MANGQDGGVRAGPRTARSRPLTGAILGTLIGLALAVVLQQQGVWPLDKITVFLRPALAGGVGVLILRIKGAPSRGALVITLIILIPMAAWGATGLTTINEVGVLNGGCEVSSETSVPDQTSVTDSSKRDPFLIDPQGSLQWAATSPVAFDDYPWKIWVEIGGVQVTLDSESSEDNDGGSQLNGDEVANIEAYAAERGIDISQLRGVYKVGGDAANTCDGFGFVKLIADPLETLIAKIAAGLLILLLIILIVLAIVGRRRPLPGAVNGVDNSFLPGDFDRDGDVDFDDYGGHGPGTGPGDPPEVFADGFESGDKTSWSQEGEPPGEPGVGTESGPAAEIAAGAMRGGYRSDNAERQPPEELDNEDINEIVEAFEDKKAEGLGDSDETSGLPKKLDTDPDWD